MTIKFHHLTIVENGGMDTKRGEFGQFAKGQAVK